MDRDKIVGLLGRVFGVSLICVGLYVPDWIAGAVIGWVVFIIAAGFYAAITFD